MNPATQQWGAPSGLAGWRWRAERPRAAVLLQHGYAEHAGRYVDHANRLIPALVAAGFDVFAFDLHGHGRSSGRRGDTDVRVMVSAHVAARRAIAKESLPLFLIGHSLGGLVTAGSVARAPANLAGVILSAPSLPSDLAWPRRAALALAAAVAPLSGVAPAGNPAALSRIDDEVAAYRTDPLVFRRPLPARLAATALAAARDVWRGVATWQAPTLVVHGTADTATDPSGSERLVAAIPAPDKELMLVPDGRHELLNDLPRDAVLAHILDWLERRVSA